MTIDDQKNLIEKIIKQLQRMGEKDEGPDKEIAHFLNLGVLLIGDALVDLKRIANAIEKSNRQSK